MSEILNPQDAELEEVILGACLIEREAMPMVADRLRPEMFYFEKNALIYAALQAMYRDGRQIDIITVKNELGARGKLDAAGGPYELVRISGRVVSSVHLEYHVRILHEKHLRREMILGFHKLLALAADETTDIADTLVDAHNLLDRFEGECGTIDHLRDMDTLMDDTLQQVDARQASGINGITGIPTGLADLQLCDMKSDQKNRNREQEVAQTTRKAKLMAKELNVPVLLLSQLNRGSDGRPFSRPILSDLRESGAIEQDADMVMLLYRPALSGIKTEPVSKYPTECLGVVMVAKHRNGETGDVYFAHNPSMTKLGEYVPPTEWLMRNAK